MNNTLEKLEESKYFTLTTDNGLKLMGNIKLLDKIFTRSHLEELDFRSGFVVELTKLREFKDKT